MCGQMWQRANWWWHKLLFRAVNLSHGYKENVEFPLLPCCIAGPRSSVVVFYYFTALD